MVELDTQAVGTGIALGAGIGSTTALLAGGDIASGAGYGVGAGIIVGTLLARLAPRFLTRDHPRRALVGGGLVLGTVVGGFVGVVAAWGIEAPFVAGVLVGGASGAVLGLLIAGVLAAAMDDETVV